MAIKKVKLQEMGSGSEWGCCSCLSVEIRHRPKQNVDNPLDCGDRPLFIRANTDAVFAPLSIASVLLATVAAFFLAV